MDLLEQIKLFLLSGIAVCYWERIELYLKGASLYRGTKKTLPSPRIREDVGKRSVHIAAKGLGPLTERI